MRWARLSAASVLLLLAGCSGSQHSLTIAVNRGVEGTALKEAANEWANLRRTHVEIVELPYANLFEKELLDLTSGTGAYDVVMLDDPWFPRLAQNNRLSRLKHAPESDFLHSCLDVCRQPYRTGDFYAVPYVGNSQLFFYRKDLFDKYKLGIPDSWDHVLAAARTIGKGEKMFGYVMRAAPGNPVVADFIPLLWAFGGDVLDGQGKPSVNTPAAVDALRFMLELGKYSPPGYANFNADEVSAHLLQGTAAMSINWPAWISAMDDPQKSKAPGEIAFAPMPREKAEGVAELGAWLLAVPAAAQHADAAFDFIDWATSADQMRTAALRGNPPTRRSVFQSPDLIAKFRAFPVQLKALESARPRPRSPLWNEIENSFGVRLSEANAGSTAPEEALRMAQTEIAAILERGQ